jgi:hypothetical protein
MKTLINEIKQAYEFGNTYFTGEINGEEFKIRMNKDHARNGARNDDFSIHNLSLINTDCPSGVGSKNKDGKYQMQVDNVFDWSDAEIQIEEFFYQIQNI